MKAEALKEQTKASRPIKALTMYPPNTPATLVPRVLPTKSQVKINIFTLIQLFSEFEKTCKKRITPTGLTEGERGFKQTKECYLIEVIPFFKTLKEHFEGIQKALTKEIKEMKDIFEELEAEVDQNIVHRKHAEIERKNLLIANDNLIADCLSKDVDDAHTVVQARCLVLEAELSKFWDKIQTDDHNELVNRFSNVEIKQHYKELYDSIKITRAKHIELTTALLTENENLKVQIHNKMQCVTTNPIKPRVLALGKYAIDVKPIPPRNRNNREVHLDYLKHLKESVETICEIVKEAKVERPLDRSLASACLYTKHSQELLEYVIGTCPKDFNQRDKKHAYTPLTKKKQVTLRTAPNFLMPGQISSGLVPNLVPAAPSPTHLHLLPLIKMHLLQFIHRQLRHYNLPSLHQGVAAESTIREDNPFAHVDNDSFINVFAPEPSSEASSSGDLSSAESP
ncbi:hypothetical protein Tco_1493485 [Tanacetum coccineum]